MDLSFLSEADAITLEFERAKRGLESAKAAFENAKKSYEDLLARADDHGIPKAKLKKLTEDRIQSLFDSGLLNFLEGGLTAVSKEQPKAKRSSKPKKSVTETTSDETVQDLEL